ncbi:hypothetical protein [Blastococcus goldschmidtiae]|uniref:Lipoprotein n=1 Tax=Blastococcus goldschmidtiae TaxID=3075546 RepID=A0ABU2K5J0_9ACTN|nr:hypothetical protein [Blastococcus sp. DSM 46792]MDT0275468.1 hypothetical protein [Blastococcus sp. DSM 46792]
MRTTRPLRTTTSRTAAAVFAVATALGVAACGNTDSGADIEDVPEDEVLADGPYEGRYEVDFFESIDDYADQEVTLTAAVDEVVRPDAFTIGGTGDVSVEALLVVGAEQDQELTPGATVEVTGTVKDGFVITDVEEELGVDLDGPVFEEFEDEPYIVAEDVEVLENAD